MKDVFIANTASVYGDVKLSEGVNIWFNVSIRGDLAPISIGKNTNIQDNSVVHVDHNHETKIGEYVTIGHSSIIHGCTIEDNVLVGMGTTILNGAVIKEKTIIGAGSLVTQNKEFPSNALIMGRPAKFVRNLTETEIASIRKNALEYRENGMRYKNNEYKQIK